MLNLDGGMDDFLVLVVVTRDAALTAAQVRERLAVHEEIVHATIEIHYRAT